MRTDMQARFSTSGLRAIVTAIWGACAGFYLTAIFLLPGLDTLMTDQIASHVDPRTIYLVPVGQTVPWQQALQKRAHVLACLCCPLLAWLSLRWRSRIGGWRGIASIVFFVPAITLVFAGISRGEPRIAPFLAAAAVLAFPPLKLGWYGYWQPTPALRAGQAEETAESIQPPTADAPRFAAADGAAWRRRLAFGLLLVGLSIIALMPWNIHEFADALTYESHITSFLIAPGLSLLRPNAVPALDFESHYGLGAMYVFSYFLNDSYHNILVDYLWFLFAILTFYHVTAYVVLCDFFRSELLAFLAAIVLVLVSMEGLSYHYPSNWPIRFPFLFLFVAAAAREQLLGRSWLPVLTAGLFAGLSLFWQTDIGLFLVVSGASYYLALSVRERSGFARAPLFLLATAATFAALAVAAFGPLTVSLLFYRRLLDPLLAYGTGFGFHPVQWRAGWPYLYNVIAPVVTLGTLGFALKQFCASESQKQQARYLFLFGTCGLIMVSKWVNRSIDPIWSINAAGIIVVLFWWACYVTKVLSDFLEARIGQRLFGKSLLHVRTVTGCAAVFGLLSCGLLASCFHDPTGVRGFSTSPLVRLKVFTSKTPTLAHRLLRNIRKLEPEPPLSSPVHAADIELIRANTSASDPVTLLAASDWIYLSEAHRAPAFAWVPIYLTYSVPLLNRAEKTMTESDLLFVERGSLENLEKRYPAMYQRIYPIFNERFTLAATGKNLDMYRRKNTGGLSVSGKSTVPPPGM